MLVLSRKIGEKIRIGDDITIQVRRLYGNRVTLAVEAPLATRILRTELLSTDEQPEGEGCRESTEGS